MRNRVIFTFLLIFAMILPLAACSGEQINPTQSGSSAASSSGSAVVVGPSGNDSSESAPAAPSGEASSAPVSSGPAQVSVTIPEGFTLSQIGDRLEARGVCKKADFVKAAQSYDFSYYPLVKQIPANARRCYRLEGYLYPETYDFFVGMKPQDAVGKFLRVAEEEIGGKYSYSGMTTDQVITLASIIEREAQTPEDMKKVSSVFHNRLKQKMILQADSTRDYCNNYLIPVFGDSSKYAYNTYPNRAPGLPAGPICNPGASALAAAAHPADTDFLYFATGTNHKFYYGKTEAERDALMKADHVAVLYGD